jgi:hypothetical protein
MTPETYAAIVRGYLTPDQRTALAHFLVSVEAMLGIPDERPAWVLEVLRAEHDRLMHPFDLPQTDQTGQETPR